MRKNLIKFLLLTIAFTFALSINYIFAAWTGPTQAPPLGNTPTPVHIGTTNQVKDGGLSLNSLAVFGNGYFQDNVGIGTAAPDAKLRVDTATARVRFGFNDGTNDFGIYQSDQGGTEYNYFQNNVGIGTASPMSPAPNNQPGNLDVNDIYLASIGKWISQVQAQTVSGGCYVSYSGGCLAGFTNKGSAGSWGSCDYGIAGNWHGHFRPAGGSCKSGWVSSTDGNANICCQ